MRMKICLAAVVLAVVAKAGQAEEETAAWQKLPAEWSIRLIVGDPLPPLRKVLGSEALRKTLLEGKLAETLEASQQRLGVDDSRPASRLATMVMEMGDVREKLDPQNWLAAIEQKAAFVPEEIAIAAPESSAESIGDWFQAVALMQLTTAAVKADDHVGELQDEVVKLLKRTKVPQLTARVRFRSPQLPQLLFAQAEAVARQAVPPQWKPTIDDSSLGFKVRLGDVYDEQTIAAIVGAIGLAADTDDKKVQAMASAAAKLELELWLERDESDLMVTLGKRPASGERLTAKELGPLWSDNGSVVFASMQFAGLKRRIREAVAMVDRFADSPLGKAAKEADGNDFFGTLRRMDEALSRGAEGGSFRLSLGESLEVRSIAAGAQPGPPLGKSPVLKLIPKDVEWVTLSTIDSLGQSLAATLDNFEDRLETRSIQYDITGKTDLAAQMAKFKDYYYGQMQDVRRLVFEVAKTRFVPPLATLWGSSGRVERLKATIDMPDGKRNAIEIRNVPSPEYAVIAQAENVDEALQFVAELAARLRGHLRGEPVAADEKPTPLATDLGLGVPTFGFGGLGSTAPGEGEKTVWSIEVEGDLSPHYFAVERFVVVSTSVRLSKAILAASRGTQAGRFVLPPADAGVLVGYGVCPAETLARLIEQISAWSAALADAEKTTAEGELFAALRPTAEGSQTLAGMIAGAAEIVRLIDRSEWRVYQTAAGRQARLTVFPKGAAKGR